MTLWYQVLRNGALDELSPSLIGGFLKEVELLSDSRLKDLLSSTLESRSPKEPLTPPETLVLKSIHPGTVSLCKRCPRRWTTSHLWVPLRKSCLFKVYVNETLKTYQKIGIRVSDKDRQRVEATPHRIISRRVLEIYDDFPFATFQEEEVEGKTPEEAFSVYAQKLERKTKQLDLLADTLWSFLSFSQVSFPLLDGVGSPSP